MSNSDTPLVAIKEAEASFAKLTMEDKLSHPPPDIVSLCTLNIKRLKISDTAPLPVDATPSNEHQQLSSKSRREHTLQLSKKHKAFTFKVNDPKRQLKRMQKVKQLERSRKRIAALEKKLWYKQTLVWTKEYELHKQNYQINKLKQKSSQLTEKLQTASQALEKLHQSCDAKSKVRVIAKPKSIIAKLKRKRSMLVHTVRNNDSTNMTR